MFNQFRNVLESVAQPIRVLDTSSESNTDNISHSSPDMQGPRSSGQLAESAMSSLRKSLASQRVNPAPDSSIPSPSTSTTRKSTLEERLRRAAQGSPAGSSGLPSPAASSSPPSARGRSDLVASQTKKIPSRAASSSPATRGRPLVVSESESNKPPSRSASPAVASSVRPVGSSASRIKPSTRPSSPAPSSKPPSRVSSPAPASRSASTNRRTSSPAPSRPPSRAGSPTPAARTRRASELGGKGVRAASPSSFAKHQSPLRRSSIIANNNTPLSNLPITMSTSTDSVNSNGESANTSEEETISLVSTHDKEGELVSGTVIHTKQSAPQSCISEDDITRSQEEELQIPTQASLPTDETMKSISEVTGNGTDVIVGAAVPAVATVLSEPPILESTPSQAEIADVADFSPHRQKGVEEPEVTSPAKIQSEGVENDSRNAFLVNQEEKGPGEVPLSDSMPSAIPPVLSSESLQSSSDDQETERPNRISDIEHSAEVERLQARLKELEQRFSDVSTSFKRLQTEKLAADAILKENSPLESFNDPNALRDYFVNLRIKDEVFQEEIKRVTGKLELQDDRMQELKDAHNVEKQGLSEELRQMKTHLHETETLFEAAQRATSSVEKTADKQKEDISRLEKELEKSKNLAKEEEEKRVKAITLLKTVRQKLVKAEKDREDVMKEMAIMRERERGDKDKEQTERLSLQRDLEVSQSAHAQEVVSMKSQFEKDFAATRERHEQELSAFKGQHELDLSALKISHNRELTSKSSQLSALENSLSKVTRDKNSFFEQLQLRQAELESAQAHADTIQHQNTELEFQLREANDRLALVREEYAELQREAETRSREPTLSTEEIARMVSTTEAKYEARLAEMKRNITVLEKERHESEVDWSRKLKEKVQELEDLKRMLGSATRMRESEENMVASLKTELETAQETNSSLQQEVARLTLLKGQIDELERTLKEQEHETSVKVSVFEKQIDGHKAREAQLKQGNKTLREELRKVQSSAALLERQRNPGVGYWSSRPSGDQWPGDAANGPPTADSRVSISSPADTPSRSSSPTPSTASAKTDEDVNLEYVRNVVLQFLEHKERRPQLVKVLSIILHFTPQETRRLIAKV